MSQYPANLASAHLPLANLLRQTSAWRSRLLGLSCFSSAGQSACLPASLPLISVSMPPLLIESESVCESWQAALPASSGQWGAIHFRQSEDLLFGCLNLPESDFPLLALDRNMQSPLRQAAAFAYRQIFGLLDTLDLPHLYRVWNYLPDIHGESHGIERYQQFNMGRQEGFAALRRPVTGHVPSASAVGSADGPLAVCFLAGRGEPPLPLENPRQISAYHYPQQYGPRTPTFSRATLAQIGGQWTLFISGTASIVGHQSLHPGDILAQTHETLANIEAIIDAANRRVEGTRFERRQLRYKVYVRRPVDAPAIREVLDQWLGVSASALFLQADICRRELLVEIEASGGSKPLTKKCRVAFRPPNCSLAKVV
jgi:enamine deaminase RidA (YjgF/YER057c/UK114 family)